MRGQWGLILGIIAALIIATFAVINVEGVQVNYLFGTAEWPLILVIIGSVLMGGIIVGAVGMVKVYQLQQEVKRLKRKIQDHNAEVRKQREAITRTQTKQHNGQATKG